MSHRTRPSRRVYQHLALPPLRRRYLYLQLLSWSRLSRERASHGQYGINICTVRRVSPGPMTKANSSLPSSASWKSLVAMSSIWTASKFGFDLKCSRTRASFTPRAVLVQGEHSSCTGELIHHAYPLTRYPASSSCTTICAATKPEAPVTWTVSAGTLLPQTE